MAQGFFDIARLIGKGVLFSSSGKSAKTLSRAERKAQGAVDTARLRREELAGLGVLLAFVALPVALYAAHTLGLGQGGVSIEKLRASDAALDVAIFGGPPWLIECTAAGASAVPRGGGVGARAAARRPARRDARLRRRPAVGRHRPQAARPRAEAAGGRAAAAAARVERARRARCRPTRCARPPRSAGTLSARRCSPWCPSTRRRSCRGTACAASSACCCSPPARRAPSTAAPSRRAPPPAVRRRRRERRPRHPRDLARQTAARDRPAAGRRARRGAAGKVEARALQGALGAAALAAFVEQVRENKPPLKPLAKELAISRIDGKADADEPPVTTLL